ncbi:MULTISPECIES: hypothetical protein [Legionella]|uniref:Uncharacterized protein n=1 Tax=Legionella resiliens TaxID=2905958 RepID=A0ABS8X590_9GAMM|nr:MULTISPECIES: hypothetical protein [unclassified Legionella]MCE0723999.1 hypothetical protein [Legionella sp. 9fVS26]MCE3533152.1 hypothetical protein [Legionella sp. 8cVS16]
MAVKVASPLGLVLLKLFAWISRQAKKDASDFINIASNYLDFDNQDRLDIEHGDLLKIPMVNKFVLLAKDKSLLS